MENQKELRKSHKIIFILCTLNVISLLIGVAQKANHVEHTSTAERFFLGIIAIGFGFWAFQSFKRAYDLREKKEAVTSGGTANP